MLRLMMNVVFFIGIINISETCTTNFGFGAPCIFPYKFKGEIFFTCTVHFPTQEDGVVPMCPLLVDPLTLQPSSNSSEWGRCSDDCPMRRYLSNRQLKETLYHLADTHPNLAKPYTLSSRSVLGEDLTVLKLTSGVSQQRPLLKPMVRLIGNIHGNEVIGREVLVQLARLLVLGYTRDSRIRKIMDSVELHILPTMNPDGFNRGKEGECGGQDYVTGRYNENKRDLNRDFPAWFELQNNTELDKVNTLLESKEPETQAVSRWIMSEPWVLGANLHDGAVVTTYPWDHYKDERKVGDHLTTDAEIAKSIAGEYASAHLTMGNSSACERYNYLGSTVNGAAWYPKNGTLKDFGYMMSPALDFVVEMSCCKFPNKYFLVREFENNRESLLRFLERSTTAVRGRVIDLKGQPVAGVTVIFLKDSRTAGQSAGKDVFSSDRGEFWKLLVPGKYKVEAVQGGCVQSGNLPIDVSAGVQKPIELVLRRKFNCV